MKAPPVAAGEIPPVAAYDLMSEVLLGVERVPQPQPWRSDGGDCFACSLIAALRHLFPQREPPTFEDTDRWFRGRWAEPTGSMRNALQRIAAEGASDEAVQEARDVVEQLDKYEREPPTENTWHGMDRALWKARSDGWPIEVGYDMVVPQFDPRKWGYGWPIIWAGDAYADRLEAWLAAGWIALTVCRLDGDGPITPDLLLRTTDHFLVLDGARTSWQPRDGGGALQVSEVHVVDSSTRDITGWIDVRTWEKGYGGTPWMLVRRETRDCSS